MKFFFALAFVIFRISWAENTYRLCAPETIDDSTCNSLSRGGFVKCVRVTDSADCAMKLHDGKADFGVFDAEELILAYQFYPDDFTPLAQLKHIERVNEEWQFQSVVVVPSNYNVNEGVSGLEKGGLCHPGFSHTQIWNDYILKFLERKTYKHICRNESSVAENEVENIRDFFGTACRPGDWVLESTEDKRLKEKYPELCQLCDDRENCKYSNNLHHGHIGALECLTSGRGNAAYVAGEYVHQFFRINESNPSSTSSTTKPSYQFLCPQGTVQPLTQSNPCAWIQQPWGLILTRNERVNDLATSLKEWLSTNPSMDSRIPPDAWLIALNKIIQEDTKVIFINESISLKSYLVRGREVDLNERSCGHDIRWCTLNEGETKKCNFIAKEALLLGIEPKFTCIEKNSTESCLRDIYENKTDIITIDSNQGHLARVKFNLTSILYPETMEDKNSKVIAIIRDDSEYKIQNFKQIKNKYLCFPDYGGISWISFINTARFHKIIPDTCDYAEAVANLVISACTPGIKDINYSDVAGENINILNKLCEICPNELGNNSTCSAGRENEFFGDKGVLKCLEGPGDIGFIEPKNLKKLIDRKIVNQNEYRVLCRNGSLAGYTGFDIDDNCALSITIDSELVGRRDDSKIRILDTTLALLKLEDWLGYRPDSRRAIRIYDSFTDHSDLLFKDSTIALEAPNSTIKSVLAYKELFSKIDTCTSGSLKNISNFIVVFLLAYILLQ